MVGFRSFQGRIEPRRQKLLYMFFFSILPSTLLNQTQQHNSIVDLEMAEIASISKSITGELMKDMFVILCFFGGGFCGVFR